MSFACFFKFLDFFLKRIDFLRLPMENLAVSLLVFVIGQSKNHQSQTKFLVWNDFAALIISSWSVISASVLSFSKMVIDKPLSLDELIVPSAPHTSGQAVR